MPLAQVWCSDEDIAARALDDYPILVPAWQVKAQGSDGFFASGYPWILTSGSVNFLAQGVHARQVVQLTGPRSQYPTPTGDLLAIDGVSTDGSALNLRRIGMAPGLGQPPAPAAGLSGVTFAVRTFDPQIDISSDDANRVFGLDPEDPTRLPIYQIRALQQYTVLAVLSKAYAIRVKGQESDLQRRYELVLRELDQLRGHVSIKFGPLGQGSMPAGPFGARVRR